MDPQDDPSAYLASLLASTSPTHARPVQARGTYTQPAVPFNYPLSDVREQPPFGATQGSINPNLPYGHNRNLAQPAAAAIVPQPNPRTGSFAQQYQSYPYLASSLAHYQPYQDLPLGETALQTHGQDDSSLDDVIPGERTVSQDIDSEEEEGEEKPGRNLRQIRKKRKQTPVLVFDDDSDDVDYKEAPSKGTKRTKYDYDSEGAIDADAARSSSEEASEPATGPQGGFPNSNSRSKLNLKSTSSASARSRKALSKDSATPKDKEKGADAKARSEKAGALLNRKGKGRPIPKSVQECDEADLMMWQWKHNGRSWKDIRNEWVRIMGVVPGRSSLSVRLAKMEDNFIDNGAGNDLMILKYKEQVETELEDLKWKKVAAKIKEDTDMDMKPAVVRKRYQQLQDNGWVVETGGTGAEDAEGEDIHGPQRAPVEDHQQPDFAEGGMTDLEESVY